VIRLYLGQNSRPSIPYSPFLRWLESKPPSTPPLISLTFPSAEVRQGSSLLTTIDRVSTAVPPGPGPLEKARSCLAHRVYDQRAIQKKISCFAARLRDQETAVACSPMQRSVIIGGGRVVVSAYGIAGTQALPFQSGLESADKSPGDLDEAAQRALIAGRCSIDQDPAKNRLPCDTREHVDALLQRAGRVSAIDRHLAHQGMRETVCHHILGPLTFSETVLAHQRAFGTLGFDPGGRSPLKLSRAGQNTGLR